MSLVREAAVNEERTFYVAYKIISDAIETTIRKSERQELCSKLISAIESSTLRHAEKAKILADLYDKTGNMSKAYEYSQLAIKHLESIYDYDAALRYYEKAIDLKPSDYLLYADIALIYARENKKLARAAELADESLILKAENPEAKKALGYIYYRMKDYDSAKKYLTSALNQLSGDQEIKDLLLLIAEEEE